MINKTHEKLYNICKKYCVNIEMNIDYYKGNTYILEVSGWRTDEFMTKLANIDNKPFEEHGECENCIKHKKVNDNLMFCEHWHNFTEPKGFCYKFDEQKSVDNST